MIVKPSGFLLLFFIFYFLAGSYQFISIETTAFAFFFFWLWGKNKSLENNKGGKKTKKVHMIKDKCSI